MKGRRRSKRLGQHFLQPASVQRVVAAIAPKPTDAFLEIGPGRGALTRPLAAQVARLVGIEIDPALATSLASELPGHVTIIEGDFLRLSGRRLGHLLREHPGVRRLRAAGNLPYQAAAPMLFRLLSLTEEGVPFEDATVMVQREVADRLLAPPRTRDYGTLTVLVGHRARIDRLATLPPAAFRPAPLVHSALVRLTFHPPDPPALNTKVFLALVRAVFTRRRKMVVNALGALPFTTPLEPARALAQAGLDPRRRPETLELAELVRLADIYAAVSPEAVL